MHFKRGSVWIVTLFWYFSMWVASSWGFSEMTIQPARRECHACCPLHAEKPGIQPVVGNTHGTHVEQVISSFQRILRGSQLAWYTHPPFFLLWQLNFWQWQTFGHSTKNKDVSTKHSVVTTNIWLSQPKSWLEIFTTKVLGSSHQDYPALLSMKVWWCNIGFGLSLSYCFPSYVLNLSLTWKYEEIRQKDVLSSR